MRSDEVGVIEMLVKTTLPLRSSFLARAFEKAESAFPVFVLGLLLTVASGGWSGGVGSLSNDETEITSVLMDHGSIVLKWDACAGRKYVVQFGTSLPLDDSWT